MGDGHPLAKTGGAVLFALDDGFYDEVDVFFRQGLGGQLEALHELADHLIAGGVFELRNDGVFDDKNQPIS